MNMFFILVALLLVVDTRASLVPSVVKTYDDREVKQFHSKRPKQQLAYVSALALRTREVLPFVTDVLHDIIESYHEKGWVPVAHIVDQDHWFNFLKTRYLCLAFMGKQFAAGCTGGKIETYDVHTSKFLKRITAHDAPVISMVHQPASQALFSSAHDHLIKIWGGPELTYRGQLESPRVYATALLSLDANTLISGNYFGDVTKWNVELQKGESLPCEHSKEIRTLGLLNSKCFISSSSFGKVNLLDISTNTCIVNLDNAKTFYNKVAVINDHQIAVVHKNSLDSVSSVVVYDTRTNKGNSLKMEHKKDIQAIAILGAGIVTGDEDGVWSLHAIVGNEWVGSQLPSTGTKDVMALAVDPDGTNFASVAIEPVGTITHWRYTHASGSGK